MKILTTVFLILINSALSAQSFDLKSIIIDSVRSQEIPDVLIKNKNCESGSLPFLTSAEVIKFFQLHDTVVDGLKINFFSNKNEMVKKYRLKRNGSRYEIGWILRDYRPTYIYYQFTGRPSDRG